LYKIFAIGPLPIKDDVIGGTKVSFGTLCESLEQDREVNLTTLNTSRPLRNKNRFQKYLLNSAILSKILLLSLWGSFKYDVIIWSLSPTALPSSVPLFWLVTRFGRAKIILRVFGGDLDKVIESKSSLVQKMLTKTILDFDALLLQTKYLVNKFENYNKHVVWFPTTRNLEVTDQVMPSRCKSSSTSAK